MPEEPLTGLLQIPLHVPGISLITSIYAFQEDQNIVYSRFTPNWVSLSSLEAIAQELRAPPDSSSAAVRHAKIK